VWCGLGNSESLPEGSIVREPGRRRKSSIIPKNEGGRNNQEHHKDVANMRAFEEELINVEGESLERLKGGDKECQEGSGTTSACQVGSQLKKRIVSFNWEFSTDNDSDEGGMEPL
jgi:hypothetical protein